MHEPTPKLKHPAIVEAVCELRFSASQPYSIVAGAMRERLKSKFPHLEVLSTAALLGGLPEEFLAVPMPCHRFKTDRPNAMVQIGPKLLTINILPTYPSFEEYRDLILLVLDAYQSVAEPGPPTRVGLRYINHIPVSKPEETISDYLNLGISYPESLPHASQELSARILFPYPPTGTLSLAAAFPSRIGQGALGALLDLDFFLAEPASMELGKFSGWLNDAHGIIYRTFIAMITKQIMRQMRGE